jgi:uncharacterized spore protein YtfJ
MEGMNLPDLLRTIGERVQAGATVKNVYGDPLTVGDRTVIPVARISYGFGGGGGPSKHDDTDRDGRGGGGGGMSDEPCGVLEITSSGMRFVEIVNRRKMLACMALGFALGLAFAARVRRR